MYNFIRLHAIEAAMWLSQVFQKKVKQQHPLQNYKHLKCLIVISNNAYLAHKILCDFIKQKPGYYYSENSGKIVNAPCQAIPLKLIAMLSRKVSVSRAKFYSIPRNRIRDRTIIRILEKVGQQPLLQSYLYTNCTIVISNNNYFVYKLLFIKFLFCNAKEKKI